MPTTSAYAALALPGRKQLAYPWLRAFLPTPLARQGLPLRWARPANVPGGSRGVQEMGWRSVVVQQPCRAQAGAVVINHSSLHSALWNSQLNLAGKPSQLISGSLLGILGLGRQFVRARAVWSQVNQPWRRECYWYLETQHVLCKLSFRRSCWSAGGWNTSNIRGASRLPSRPTHAAAARRLTGP